MSGFARRTRLQTKEKSRLLIQKIGDSRTRSVPIPNCIRVCGSPTALKAYSGGPKFDNGKMPRQRACCYVSTKLTKRSILLERIETYRRSCINYCNEDHIHRERADLWRAGTFTCTKLVN